MRNARLVLTALVFAACTSAAHAGLFDDEEARKQIAATTARLDAVQKALEARLADIEQQSKGQSLDLLRDLDGIKTDLAKIRGQIEVLTYELTEAQKRQRGGDTRQPPENERCMEVSLGWTAGAACGERRWLTTLGAAGQARAGRPRWAPGPRRARPAW